MLEGMDKAQNNRAADRCKQSLAYWPCNSEGILEDT